MLTMGLTVLAAPTAGAATSAEAVKMLNGPYVYHIRYNNTPVQENPDTDSIVRKYKEANARVTGPCKAQYDTEGATWFTAVDCSCASKGLAWIRSYWLY
jgi:hypothetical protein